MKIRLILVIISALFIAMLIAGNKNNEQLAHYELIIKDHRFHPDQLTITANHKVVLNIKNQDDSVEEFESFDLKREKLVPAHGQILVNIGPLSAGEYKFFGEFNQATAQGIIKVQ